MINFYKKTLVACSFAATICSSALAGNPDRAGQASISQLLINPWARSSAMGGSNSSCVTGIESQYLNVAGLAHIKSSEFMFSQTNWLSGAGIGISSLGYGQKVGSSNAIGFSIMSINYGAINKTTTESPEGGLGTYNFRNLNIGLSYAKEFSNSIFGGVNVKVISENLANLTARGVAIDAGIQYQTASNKDKKDRNNVKFGIALKNVGTPMTFNGDGLSTQATLASGTLLTVNQRSSKTDLPSLLNIGFAYDYYLSNENNDNIITFAGNFLSNSFTKDNYQLGAQYSFKKMFIARVGYAAETKKGGTSSLAGVRTTALTGWNFGFTIEAATSKDEEKASRFGVDYCYRTTNPFSGSHSIGVRLAF